MTQHVPTVLLWVITRGEREEYDYTKGLIQQFQTIALPLRVHVLAPEIWDGLRESDLERLATEQHAQLNVLCDFCGTRSNERIHWLHIQPYSPLTDFMPRVRERLPLRLRMEAEHQAIAPWFVYSCHYPTQEAQIQNWVRYPGRMDYLRDLFQDLQKRGPTNQRGLCDEVDMLRQEVFEKNLQIRRLTQSEERYRRFFEEDITGDILLDRNWRIVECNTSFVKIFGFPSKAFALGFPFRQVFPDETQFGQIQNTLEATKGIQNYEIDLRRQDGQKVNVLANFFLDERESQGETFILGFLFDNTLRKSLETQLRESQRMEGLGRLAGGVAHDFNNILTVINGYAEILLSEVEAGTPQARDIVAILEAGQKAASLTSQLLAFSRKQMRSPANYNLNQLILGMEGILRRLLKESITLELDLQEALPNTFIDKAQFEQALMNLCLNAQDAMPGKGHLTLRTRKIVLDSSVYDGKDLILPGTYVELTVKDTGKGIPDDVLPHIFEPFYTTKAPGQGTGLGLATVYGIAQQNNIHIAVESQVGVGTTFRLYFQANDRPSEDHEEESGEVSTGKMNILLVEDDAMIRDYICKILRRQGHSVKEFANGEALKDSFMVEKTRWDLLITDVVMPGMSGPEMVQMLKEKGLTMPVLFVSGYPDNELEKFGIAASGPHFLHKPFKSRELIDKINSMMHR